MLEREQGSDRGEARIVVVDQNQNSLKASRQVLAQVGFKVEVAADGLEALGLIVENIPEFVLIDRACAELDGFQVAALLASREETRPIKVVIVTEKSTAFDRLKAEALGIKELLVRPFGRLELLEAVGFSDGGQVEHRMGNPGTISAPVKAHDAAVGSV